MESFFEFFSFSDPNVRMVAIGSVLLTSTAAMVGCFTFLRKKALVGDAVAHSVLPGVCLAFLFSGVKDPVLIVIGAFISGWVSLLFMDLITSKTRIKEDAAIALILSVFFGFGILLLTFIQKSGSASQSGLDQFLFGKAAALIGTDLLVFGIVSFVLLVIVFLFYKELSLVSFNADFARTIGLPVRLIEWILTSITVLAVVTGIQAVGVVLMAAMLITPPAAARYWTNSLSKLLFLSAFFGGISGLAGAFISYTAPAMPTGPWIVVVISTIAFASFFFAPQKGIFPRLRLQTKNQKKIMRENTLKLLYHLGEESREFSLAYSIDELLAKRRMNARQLQKTIKELLYLKFLEGDKNQKVRLSENGLKEGRRVVKIHRLWELYLSEYLNLAPDQVHDDAESIEHLITPELEKQLEERLNYPKLDPHDEEIPY
jgi:manganese/zinc/iron transport system permease protein